MKKLITFTMCILLFLLLSTQMSFAGETYSQMYRVGDQIEQFSENAPVVQRPKSLFSMYSIVTMDRTRTKGDIVSMAKQLPHSGFERYKVTRYSETPDLTTPYYAGSLHLDDIEDALNTVKMVRYIAGLPYENIRFTDDLNSISQHGAVLMAASNQFTHYPNKPDDMSDEFFNIAERGCSEANISAGRSNISNAVLEGFIADGGSNNIERAGHRRWILKPDAGNFGIGYARNTESGISYQGDRISMHVFDGPGYWTCEVDTFVAWPSQGDFPIQYFIADTELDRAPAYPWSINLGAEYQVPNRDNITLTLTRSRDNKVWTFDKNTPQLGLNNLPDNSMHLAVDNAGYGMTKAIIFRPDVTTLGEIRDGDVFNVNVSGIKNRSGQDTTLNYDINFFDLEAEMNKSTVNITVDCSGQLLEGASLSIDGKNVVTNREGIATMRLENNKTYHYTVSKESYVTQDGTITVGESDINKEINMVSIYSVNPAEISITELQRNGNNMVLQADINNKVRGSFHANIVVALYDTQGTLVDITISKASFVDYGKYTLSQTISNAQSGYQVKVMVLDEKWTIIPLSKSEKGILE